MYDFKIFLSIMFMGKMNDTISETSIHIFVCI